MWTPTGKPCTDIVAIPLLNVGSFVTARIWSLTATAACPSQRIGIRIGGLARSELARACLSNLRTQSWIQLNPPDIGAPGSFPWFCHYVADSVKFSLNFGHIRILIRNLAGTDQRKVAILQSCTLKLDS